MVCKIERYCLTLDVFSFALVLYKANNASLLELHTSYLKSHFFIYIFSSVTQCYSNCNVGFEDLQRLSFAFERRTKNSFGRRVMHFFHMTHGIGVMQ